MEEWREVQGSAESLKAFYRAQYEATLREIETGKMQAVMIAAKEEVLAKRLNYFAMKLELSDKVLTGGEK